MAAQKSAAIATYKAYCEYSRLWRRKNHITREPAPNRKQSRSARFGFFHISRRQMLRIVISVGLMNPNKAAHRLSFAPALLYVSSSASPMRDHKDQLVGTG